MTNIRGQHDTAAIETTDLERFMGMSVIIDPNAKGLTFHGTSNSVQWTPDSGIRELSNEEHVALAKVMELAITKVASYEDPAGYGDLDGWHKA